jgi:hypothetical protein
VYLTQKQSFGKFKYLNDDDLFYNMTFKYKSSHFRVIF